MQANMDVRVWRIFAITPAVGTSVFDPKPD